MKHIERLSVVLLVIALAALVCLTAASGGAAYTQAKIPETATERALLYRLNTASMQELCCIAGVGEKTSEGIIEARTSIGGLASV